MKRLYSIILLCLTLSAFFACTEEEQQEGPVITVKTSNLKIPAKGGEAAIEFVTDVPFEVTVDKDWCEVSVNGTIATFTAGTNESFESRYVKAVVTAGAETLDFTIQQFGYYTSGFEPSDIMASSAAASFDFAYEYDELIVAATEADWISLTVTEDNLRVDIAENTEEGTYENPARHAEISWSLGFDSGIIKVTQNNLSFMKEDSNWNVHYDGVQDYQGEDAAIISNDVTDPTASGKYGIYAVSKSDFTESGLEMDDFVLIVADAFREDVNAVIEIFASLGYSLSFGDFLYDGSDFEVFDPFDAGDYIAFAIGFTDDSDVTGHYAFSEFTVTGGSSATGYDAWLGEWEVTRGSTTDTWNIAEDVNGTTYTITGIEGRDYPVSASYLSDGTLEVRAQSEIGIYSSQTYGECQIGLYGGWSTSSFATGTYVIFTGKISGETARLTPAVVSFNDGTSYTLERVQYVATTSDGRYLTISQDRTLLPATLRRVGGGGNEGGGSENYNRFLGSWSVDGGAFTLKLSRSTADQSYWMRGWQMEEDFFENVEATFESDGTVVLYGNSEVPFATNVDIGADEGAVNMFYVGKILDEGTEYMITSGENGYACATGTMQADGSITFTGCDVELSSGGTFTFIRMEVIAIPISDPDGDYYTFRSRPNEFPLTAAKAGTSSVKANGFRMNEWTKSSAKPLVKRSISNEVYDFCTPYSALPDIPAKYRKHISKN